MSWKSCPSCHEHQCHGCSLLHQWSCSVIQFEAADRRPAHLQLRILVHRFLPHLVTEKDSNFVLDQIKGYLPARDLAIQGVIYRSGPVTDMNLAKRKNRQ